MLYIDYMRRQLKRPQLGSLELAVLKYVTEQGSATVRKVADEFAQTASLARTTVLTVLERLRAKGFVEREKGDGAFRYTPVKDDGQVLKDLVRGFVNSTLKGNLRPFVAYLAEEEMGQEEIEELRALLERLDADA